MQQFRYIFAIIITALFLAGVFTMTSAQSLFNHQINYQGKLTNSSGVPVADGVYHMTFRLYTTATSATTTNIWEEDRSTAAGDRITVTGGLFSVLLGSSTPLTSVSFNQTLYLGVEIGGLAASPSWDGEMTPRKKLGAVPAAFEAEHLGGYASSSFLRSDAVNATSTASTFLTVTNNGTGNIAVFTGSGNVGVGTTSPYAKLSVWGAGTDGAKVFEIINNASTTLMSILESGTGYFLGNIGIGTTSPASKLQVTGGASSAVGGISVNDTTSNYNIGGFYHDSGTSRTTLYDANPSGPGFDFKLFGVAGIPSNVGAYSQKLSLGTNFFGGSKYWGFDATNQNNIQSFSMKSDASDINLFSGSGYAIKLFPSGTNTSDPVLTATSTGIGIGTTTPYSKLTVWGTGTGAGQVFEIVNNASTTLARFLDNGTGYFLGNIGIGTTSPGTLLSLGNTGNDTINISATATSTFGSGLNIRTGCFAINGVCVGGGAGASTYLALTDTPSSFTTKAIPYTNSGATALLHNANFVFDGTNLGIGTSSPYAKLSVHANPAETNTTLFAVSSSTASATSSLFTILNSGNVGIGTSSPTAKLVIENTSVPIGAELITNGTFTGSAAGWGLGSDVAYSNNHVVSTYAGGDPTASTTFASVSGNTYLLTFTVSSGNAPMYFYFDNNTTPTNSGPFSTTATTTIKVGFQATYTGTDTIWFDDYNYVTSDTWTLDDVSIKQIAPPSSALKVVGFDGAPWLSLGGDILGNTALGDSALFSNTTGSYNTATGYQALYKNTTGISNTANGYQALTLNTTGIKNTANGTFALFSNTTGSYNTATGYQALYKNTTGDSNTANGYLTLSKNTTGIQNTAVGSNALINNTTGTDNTANGQAALSANITGVQNTANGSSALLSNTSGKGNTANGYLALRLNTIGVYNIGMGYQAGNNVTTGYDNIFLGHDENIGGTAITTGFNNIGMGYNIKFPAVSSSNMLNIGNFLFANLPATTTNTSLTTQPLTGQLGVGTSSPFAKLTVWGQGTGTGQAFEIANNASTTLARFLDNGTGYFLGNIGIGTTSPYAKLSIVGEAVASYFTATSTTATSTIAGDVNIGSGSLTYVNSSGVTSIANLTMGAQAFESDAGIVSWVDMPVSSSATQGTVESYSAQMGGNPLLTVYGEALGASGGVWHDGVGIGTTTPFARLSIVGVATTSASARPLFDIASTSGASFLRVTATGNLGMGTSTPQWLLQLASSTAPQLALSDGSLTSNHWTFRNTGGNLYVATSSPSTFATSSMSALTINTNGYLGIATTSPWAKLSVNGTVAMNALGASQGNAICITAGGEITNPGAAVCTGSSERFKDNIETLAPGYALDELSKLRAVSFDYKEGFYSSEDLKGSYGMIAEEVEKIDPKLVDYGYDKKPMTLKFEKFTGLLVQAVVELSDAFKALIARVAGLEEKLNTQQAEIDALKSRMNSLDGQSAGAVVPTLPPPAPEETVPALEPDPTPEPDIATVPEVSAESPIAPMP